MEEAGGIEYFSTIFLILVAFTVALSSSCFVYQLLEITYYSSSQIPSHLSIFTLVWVAVYVGLAIFKDKYNLIYYYMQYEEG